MRDKITVLTAAALFVFSAMASFADCGTAGCNTSDAKATSANAKEDAAAKAAKAAKDKAARWDFLPPVLAVVGDKKITKEEFVKDVESRFANSPFPQESITSEMLKKATPMIVENMVNKMLLLKMVEKDGITPSAAMVKSEFDKMLQAMPPQQKQMFMENLKKQNTSLEQYKEKISNDPDAQKDFAIETWVKKNIMPKIKITDKEVKTFYEEHKEQFKNPETVTASHILIKPENNSEEAKKAAKEKAESLLAKIKDGSESFEKLAEEESACPSGKKSKGNLGEFRHGQMVKEFEDAAFAMKPGQISNVVETQFGYHIIKVTAKKESKLVPFEKVEGFIRQQLTGQKIQEDIQKALEAEKKAENVKINV